MKVIAPIHVLIDTREQTPWSFDPELFTFERAKLDTGDYSVRDMQSLVAVERKTLGDCVNTVIHGWTRFRRELYRLAAMDHPLMVVEASIADILDKKYESDAEPAAVLGRLISIGVDHGVPVIFAGSREVAESFVAQWLRQVVRKNAFTG